VPCSCYWALLLSVGEVARRRPVGSAGPVGHFELAPLADKLDRFGQDMGAETEGALDDAGLAAGTVRNSVCGPREWGMARAQLAILFDDRFQLA
jgi:hypothetical protein